MIATWGLLLQSRKFWIGAITIAAILGAVGLVALGKLDQSALVTTISAIAGLGIATIGSIAWEDTAKTAANSASANSKSLMDTVSMVAKSVVPSVSTTAKESDETKQ